MLGNKNTKLALLALMIFSLPIFYGCKKAEESREDDGGIRAKILKEGDAAPAFKLKTLDGKDWSFEAAAGKPKVLNFFASWCTPCKAEASTLEKSYKGFGGKVEFAGIAVQDSAEGASGFVKEFGITFPVGVDETGDIGASYVIYGLPKTFVIGREGRITFSHTGAVTGEVLAREINKVL